MNIDDFRAMVEAEKNAQQPNNEGTVPHAQTEQGTTEPAQPVVQETPPSQSAPSNEGTQTETQTEPIKNEPQLFDVGGQKVTLDELQRGYLRQSDYTRKTQEVARQQRELEEFNRLKETLVKQPELAQQVGYDPQQAQVQNLEQQYYDLLLQQEVNSLSTKYADFESSEVLNFAYENNLTNLEHAYLLHKQLQPAPAQLNTTPEYTQPANEPVDVEALKAQIRSELQQEMHTSTIITGSGTPPQPQAEVKLTEHESKIARAFGLTPEQYKKWSQ
jgi:hypothetical protein